MILTRYEKMIARRYLLPGKGEGFIFLVASISLVAVMLGVAALIIVMSVMNGFRAELFEKTVGLNGHAVIQGYDGKLPDWRPIADAARKLPGVTSATPLIEQPLMASYDGRVEGVLVQRMEPRGVELILGARRDGQWGTMVLVGLGGVQAELWKDVQMDVAPVSPARAEAMLRALRSWPLLDGFRGAPKVDVAKVAEAISRFSAFAAACGVRLEEAEINPLLCRPDGCVAVDGLMTLSGAQQQPQAQGQQAKQEAAAEA